MKNNLIIDGETWRIKRKKLPTDRIGEMDPGTRVIAISPSLADDVAADILGHEIIHVWLEQTGLAGFLTEDQQEGFCDAFGRKLTRFVQENYVSRD